MQDRWEEIQLEINYYSVDSNTFEEYNGDSPFASSSLTRSSPENSETPQKSNVTPVLPNVTEILESLDEDIVRSEILAFNPGVEPIIEEVEDWTALIKSSVAVFELWKETQRRYLFLLPIFSVEEIRRRLPAEGVRFLDIDQQCYFQKYRQCKGAQLLFE